MVTRSEISVLVELRQLDHDHRNEVHFIAEVKVNSANTYLECWFIMLAQNEYTEQCIVAVRRISLLNNDVVQIPPALAALQASFRGKNSFSHIQRLHNMLYAYGATVIEIVRRKEFCKWYRILRFIIRHLTPSMSSFLLPTRPNHPGGDG